MFICIYVYVCRSMHGSLPSPLFGFIIAGSIRDNNDCSRQYPHPKNSLRNMGIIKWEIVGHTFEALYFFYNTIFVLSFFRVCFISKEVCFILFFDKQEFSVFWAIISYFCGIFFLKFFKEMLLHRNTQKSSRFLA